MIEQPELLEHDTDAPAQRRQFVALRQRDIAVEQGYEAVGRTGSEINQFQQRGFTGAAGAGQEMERTGFEFERHVMQDFRPEAVAHADILESDHPYAASLAGHKSKRSIALTPASMPELRNRRPSGENCIASRRRPVSPSVLALWPGLRL